MKTLCLMVGLLLLTLYCSAMPPGVREVSPASCCFHFFAKPIPRKEIRSISKTHSRCSEKAFVFDTPKGLICVSQNRDWAKKAFQQLHSQPQQ
ncbi:C-C motif chemokine 5-like [Betta splendens]|uniref:C-C motif chemokine 5-like n=1 Tax=Betta splendens TaxID=158456 RepID=A0A6P7MWW3_BETSP|nr:C-C motif chemokine 5-like [Betta splendens]